MALRMAATSASSAWFLALLAVALAACSAMDLGRREQKPVDPNVYPANYKTDLVTYVKSHPDEMLSSRDAYVSEPALTQFGSETRYFACLRVDGANWRKDKMVVFFSGTINQFVDATSEQCRAPAYQPFPELVAMLGQLGTKK
jgi:hypothetical protein